MRNAQLVKFIDPEFVELRADVLYIEQLYKIVEEA